MPRWLQAEVWDVLTGLELRDKPETVVRNNGAGAASSGNMHKYVHRMADHSDNKPALQFTFKTSQEDCIVTNENLEWWLRLGAAVVQPNVDLTRHSPSTSVMIINAQSVSNYNQLSTHETSTPVISDQVWGRPGRRTQICLIDHNYKYIFMVPRWT